MSGQRQTSDEDTARVFAAAGVAPTEAGRERARAKLAAADARLTPERKRELRARMRRYSSGS
jgi:hypothetical protein